MAWTQAHLDAFDTELQTRGSVTSLTFSDGQSVSFASLAEAMEFRSMIAGIVAESTSASPPKNIRYAVTSKGA